MSVLRRIANQLLADIITILEKPIVALIGIVSRRPAVLGLLNKILSRFPHLQHHLMQLHRRSYQNPLASNSIPKPETYGASSGGLNRSARVIYAELMAATEKRNTRD